MIKGEVIRYNDGKTVTFYQFFGKSRNIFSLEQLNTICKSCAGGYETTLFTRQDAPLVVEFSLDAFGRIRYYLAPKHEV